MERAMIRAVCDFCGNPFEDFSKSDNRSAAAGPKLCPNCALCFAVIINYITGNEADKDDQSIYLNIEGEEEK